MKVIKMNRKVESVNSAEGFRLFFLRVMRDNNMFQVKTDMIHLCRESSIKRLEDKSLVGRMLFEWWLSHKSDY